MASDLCVYFKDVKKLKNFLNFLQMDKNTRLFFYFYYNLCENTKGDNMPFLNNFFPILEFYRKNREKVSIPIPKNKKVEIYWEFLSWDNYQEWLKDYEPNKRKHLFNIFASSVSNYKDKPSIPYIKIIPYLYNKILAWDIKIILEYMHKYFTPDHYFYFLKVRIQNKTFYLGFIYFIDNLSPYNLKDAFQNCNFFRCNNTLITLNSKVTYLSHIYAHYNYKEIIYQIFKKDIKFTDLCSLLIKDLTNSDIYWLAPDTKKVLEKVYNMDKGYYPLLCLKTLTESYKISFLKPESNNFVCKEI